jgi:hypothetical protein
MQLVYDQLPSILPSVGELHRPHINRCLHQMGSHSKFLEITVPWSFSISGDNWKTSENVEGGPFVPEPAAKGDFWMEYSSD